MKKTRKRMRCYISGQITGLSVEEYTARFGKAEAILQGRGYETVNPLRNGQPADARWEDQIKTDIRLLLDCDAIYMLANWDKSEGAILERNIARTLGLILEYETPPKHREIKLAIETAMGISYRTIAQDSRNRWHVYARMIYCHHARKAGEPAHNIAKETAHDYSTICYYLRKYENEYKFNPEFRGAAEKVATLLSKKMPKTKQE